MRNLDDDSSDDEPLTSLRKQNTEESPRMLSAESPKVTSAKKKRRVKAFAQSDSEDR